MMCHTSDTRPAAAIKNYLHSIDYNIDHALDKGDIDSSILSGGTIFLLKTQHAPSTKHLADLGRTLQEYAGKCGDLFATIRVDLFWDRTSTDKQL